MEALVLLRSVREVAALANPGDPLTVSQRAFDAAAEKLHPGSERGAARGALPRAKRIAERLGLPWRVVVAVAHEPGARQNQSLAVRARERNATWVTDDGVRSALRLVAHRLGGGTVTLGEYRAGRGALLAADGARWMHGRQLRLPSDEQVVARAGSWDAALRLAGLETARERGRADGTRAPRLTDLLARFHDHYWVQPSARDLRAFARGNGVPYPAERDERFAAAVAEWRHQRREHGLPEPRVPRRVGGRGHKAPDYTRDVGAARPGERRRDTWSRAGCVAAVARYLADAAGQRSSLRGYADWAASHDDAPAPSTIQEHGGWEAARRDAIASKERH